MSEGEFTKDQLEYRIAHRDLTLEEADAADAEEKLVDYTKFVWEYVEPTRPFIRGWAIDAICDHLEAVESGEIRRLLMNVPPGFMKSLATDVLFPSWLWGPRNKPGLRFVCASYSQDLTIRDNLRTRILIGSDRYQRWWGDRFAILGKQDAKEKFQNNFMGFKIATSVHGLSTGERGDIVIVDDPHNVLEAESDAKRNSALQWFTEVMPTRVNDAKTAAFIVIMQRVHEADVSGLILEKDLGYTHLCIPMHYDPYHPHVNPKRFWKGWSGDPRTEEGQLAFPERYGSEEIREMSKVMMSWGGTYAVAGQFEQRPEPRGGGMVKQDWFELVDSVPDGFHNRCCGWDFAGTDEEKAGNQTPGSAYVLMTEVSLDHDKTDLYIEDVWWEHVSPGGLYKRIKFVLPVMGYTVFHSLPKDPGQAGVYQVDDLLEVFSGYDFEFTPETGSKELRFKPFAAQVETRNMVHRRIKVVKASWNEAFFDQITKFPRGRYKDIPDCTSRAYHGIVQRGGGAFVNIAGSSLIKRKGTSDEAN